MAGAHAHADRGLPRLFRGRVPAQVHARPHGLRLQPGERQVPRVRICAPRPTLNRHGQLTGIGFHRARHGRAEPHHTRLSGPLQPRVVQFSLLLPRATHAISRPQPPPLNLVSRSSFSPGEPGYEYGASGEPTTPQVPAWHPSSIRSRALGAVDVIDTPCCALLLHAYLTAVGWVPWFPGRHFLSYGKPI